jgi:hypothetical protein
MMWLHRELLFRSSALLPSKRLHHQLQMHTVVLQIAPVSVKLLELFAPVDFEVTASPKVPNRADTDA